MGYISHVLEGSGRQNQSYFMVRKALGGSMCSILRVWKQNVNEYITFARFWDGRLWEEGSGRLNVSYSTCLEAQNVDKFITFAWFWDGRLWEAKSIVFYVSGRLWEAQSVVLYASGSSKRR